MAQVSGAHRHGAHVQSTKKIIGGESGAARAAPVPTALPCIPSKIRFPGHTEISDLTQLYHKRQHTTCSFRVTSVCTKCCIEKQLRSMFGLKTRQPFLVYTSNQENRYLSQWSNRQIGKTSLYHLQLSTCECNYAQYGVQESHRDACFWR